MAGAAEVHPLALVERGAELGAGVKIGPFCHVGSKAVLGDGVELVSHVAVAGTTSIGAGTVVYPHAALGGPPQDVGYKGEPTSLAIGRNCRIREGFTAHLGSPKDRGHTQIGDNCFLMAYSHVAHDCIVGNGVIIANGAVMGGHCEIGDNVMISGLVAVHQFVRIGRGAMLAGCSGIAGDVIPYAIAQGNRANLRGLNVVGLRRSGAAHSEINELRRAFGMLFDRRSTVAENIVRVRTEFPDGGRVAEVLDFMESRGKRIFTVPTVGLHESEKTGGA